MVGVSAGLIPFLEHDNANRALMGSNMQRQAVPLLVTEPPLVATGLEPEAAKNSSMLVRARNKGTVTFVDARRIEIGGDVYNMRKFVGLNERTCQNQKPIVHIGDKVEKGQVIADGAATYHGELALGRNALAAFMAWDGFNFEDAIIVGEELRAERHLHLDPHRGVRHRDPRDQARPRGVHPRHPQRQREDAAQPRRERDRAGGHVRPAGRHPGRQGLAQVEDRADAGREAAARDLRPGGRGREERLAGGALRGRGDRHRRAEVLPPDEPLGGGAEGVRERAEGGRGQGQCPHRRHLRHPGGQDRGGPEEETGRRGQPAAGRGPGASLGGRDGGPVQPGLPGRPQHPAPRRARKAPQAGVAGGRGRHRRPGPQAQLHEARRRAPQRRPPDGQGVHRGQAGHLGRRQDGRAARQQGRDRQDPARRGHAVPGRRHAASRSC